MKTYHADSNDHDAVARALLEKYQDQQAVSKALHALESIAHRYASALMAAASETYSTDVEKASRQAKTDLTNALQAFLAEQASAALPLPAVELVGVKDGKETILGEVPMPPTMKARELLREQGFTDLDDEMSHDACALWACESLVAYCHAYYTAQAAPAPAGEAVRAFREYLAVHEVSGRMDGHAVDDMALGLARIALDFQAAPAADDAPKLWAVMAECGQGVIFDHEQDARWTLTGRGAGQDGFGVPTIGEELRDSYEGHAFTLHRVRLEPVQEVEALAAKEAA